MPRFAGRVGRHDVSECCAAALLLHFVAIAAPLRDFAHSPELGTRASWRTRRLAQKQQLETVMEQSARKPLHPLITVAAIAVIVFCAAGIAAITGLIPTSRSDSPSVAAPQPPAASSAAPALAPKTTLHRHAEPRPEQRVAARDSARTQRSAPALAAAGPSPTPAVTVCHDCGTVLSIREVKQTGEGSGVGAVAGGVAGAVVGNQVGAGRGRDIATIVGAVGGAVAGHQVEKHVKSNLVYQIAVEMEDGGSRTFIESARPSWRPGDRVRIDGDRLIARG